MGIKEIKEILGFGNSNKGVDCQDDPETGTRHCRAMIRHRNQKLSTGSEWNLTMDSKTCKATIINRSSIFEDDEELVRKTIKQAESDCRGVIN